MTSPPISATCRPSRTSAYARSLASDSRDPIVKAEVDEPAPQDPYNSQRKRRISAPVISISLTKATRRQSGGQPLLQLQPRPVVTLLPAAATLDPEIPLPEYDGCHLRKRLGVLLLELGAPTPLLLDQTAEPSVELFEARSRACGWTPGGWGCQSRRPSIR